MRVLLADDEETIAVTLGDALEEAGYEVVSVANTQAALDALDAGDIDVVLTDIRMPGKGGMEVLTRSVDLDPARPVVIMTGFASMDQAVEAVEIGASFYVQKPFRNQAMVSMVDTLARMRELQRENERLRGRLEGADGFRDVIGQSDTMRAVFERVRTVAPTDATVLIEGESGTGKERIALALHEFSERGKGPFVPISCAALPESLLEAELFGSEKGAFTDARKETARALRARGRRHPVPRRHRRHAAGGAGQAPARVCRSAPSSAWAARLRETSTSASSQRPRRRCVSWSVRDGKFREDLFYRDQRRADRPAARCANAGRRAAPGPAPARAPRGGREYKRLRRDDGARSSATPGRATCASWRTRCSARSPCAGTSRGAAR